jgi:hypothetical protein
MLTAAVLDRTISTTKVRPDPTMKTWDRMIRDHLMKMDHQTIKDHRTIRVLRLAEFV